MYRNLITCSKYRLSYSLVNAHVPLSAGMLPINIQVSYRPHEFHMIDWCAIIANNNLMGETFGNGSACFQQANMWILDGTRSSNIRGAGCYQVS